MVSRTASDNNHAFRRFLDSLHRVCSFSKICLPSQRLRRTRPLSSQARTRNHVVVFFFDNLVPVICSILTDPRNSGLAVYRVYSSLDMIDIGGLESGDILELFPECASISVGSYGQGQSDQMV